MYLFRDYEQNGGQCSTFMRIDCGIPFVGAVIQKTYFHQKGLSSLGTKNRQSKVRDTSMRKTEEAREIRTAWQLKRQERI